MPDLSYNPRARFLGAELRDVRERAKVGVRELAKRLGIGHSRISLWENGRKIPTTEDVASFLAALGVVGDERDELLEKTRQAEQKTWVASGIPGIAEQLNALMEFERISTEIVDWCPLVLPGLLQTGDYARAIMGSRPQADTRVAMRLGRRDVLTRRNAVTFTALVNEAALRQPIAEPDIMDAQLRRMLDDAKLPNVTLQVVPSGTSWHPGLMGPFILLRFPKGTPIVHLEHHRASTFVFEDDDIEGFEEAVTIIREKAMSPEDSAAFIEKIISEERA
jgi:transcriptional regulator with XRE-family HTH domain